MKRQYGFTLVELIVIIFITSILAAYAMPRFTSKMFDVRAAAGELMEAIKYTQEMSMVHSGDTHYQIELLADGYRVTQGGTDIIDPQSNSTPYANSWSGITLDQLGTISFDSRGKPSCSAPLPACSEPTDSDLSITVTADSDSVAVTLARLTGYTYAN